MASELDKQRKKLREISYTLDQQHQLLRLIIQVSETSVTANVQHTTANEFIFFLYFFIFLKIVF